MGWIITHHRAVNTPHGHLLCFQVVGSATHSLTLCPLILSKKHTITQVFTLSPVSIVLSLLLLILSRRPFSLPTLSPPPSPLSCSLSFPYNLLSSLVSLPPSCVAIWQPVPVVSLNWPAGNYLINTNKRGNTNANVTCSFFKCNFALLAPQCCGSVHSVSVVILNVKSIRVV